jgi:hypothetical protein
MGAPILGYMCKIDWEYELGEASGGSKVYYSKKDLLKHHSCAKHCGIVKVVITFDKVILKGTGK